MVLEVEDVPGVSEHAVPVDEGFLLSFDAGVVYPHHRAHISEWVAGCVALFF